VDSQLTPASIQLWQASWASVPLEREHRILRFLQRSQLTSALLRRWSGMRALPVFLPFPARSIIRGQTNVSAARLIAECTEEPGPEAGLACDRAQASNAHESRLELFLCVWLRARSLLSEERMSLKCSFCGTWGKALWRGRMRQR